MRGGVLKLQRRKSCGWIKRKFRVKCQYTEAGTKNKQQAKRGIVWDHVCRNKTYLAHDELESRGKRGRDGCGRDRAYTAALPFGRQLGWLHTCSATDWRTAVDERPCARKRSGRSPNKPLSEHFCHDLGVRKRNGVYAARPVGVRFCLDHLTTC